MRCVQILIHQFLKGGAFIGIACANYKRHALNKDLTQGQWRSQLEQIVEWIGALLLIVARVGYRCETHVAPRCGVMLVATVPRNKNI